MVSVEVRRPVRILERRRFQDVLGGASGWSGGAAQEELLEPQTAQRTGRWAADRRKDLAGFLIRFLFR